jgi:hypothetical protein
MNRHILVFLTFFLLSSAKSVAQDFPIKEDCLLFRDAKTNQSILILEDSILYKGKSSKKIVLKHTPYPDKLTHYINFNILDKTYLVNDGCGPVLEYRNDSIVRIDNSFLHQNQCAAVSFVYKNEIYYFGGYGLFTYKNILTKFDFTAKEWNLIQTFGNEIPSPRSAAHGIVIKDDLYVFAGKEENLFDIHGSKECDNTIWKLHLPDMKWSKIGQFNEKFFFKDFISFCFNDKLYCYDIRASNLIIEIDIIENTIKKYRLTTIFNFIQLNFDSKKKEITFVNNQFTNHTFQYLTLKWDKLIGKPFSEESFNYPISTKANFLWFIPIVLLSVIWYYRKKIAIIVKPFRGIVYNRASQSYFYKGKIINTFEETELRILDFLIENSNRFISLNELNKLFENNELFENFSTTLKRRENTVIGLFLKLTLITRISESQFLISRKNPDDKRIREVKFSPDFIKIK